MQCPKQESKQKVATKIRTSSYMEEIITEENILVDNNVVDPISIILTRWALLHEIEDSVITMAITIHSYEGYIKMLKEELAKPKSQCRENYCKWLFEWLQTMFIIYSRGYLPNPTSFIHVGH